METTCARPALRAVPVIALLVASALVPCPAGAQQPVAGGSDDQDAPAERDGRIHLGIEAKTHYRHSDANRFPVNFPFTPDMLPPGQSRGSIATVDPGDHLELSVLTLFADVRWGEAVQAHAKVDLYDLYDRNPTSGDRKVDVDEAWIRFGRESLPAVPADGFGGYVKVGKFAQDGAAERPASRVLRRGVDGVQPVRGPGDSRSVSTSASDGPPSTSRAR